ncbi:MAG: hypothetical protein GC161_06065 [Planctomycetaceae bacterium]|nr:hypothetical protein [Planctomycetaceae bacterium]
MLSNTPRFENAAITPPNMTPLNSIMNKEPSPRSAPAAKARNATWTLLNSTKLVRPPEPIHAEPSVSR